jgi:uncharacterized protein (DUF1697 family)
MKIAVFLRAVNLGPVNKVNMEKLRSILLEAGFADVVSYLNSGNLTMQSEGNLSEDIVRIQSLISRYFSIAIDVFAIEAEKLRRLIENHPFEKLDDDQVPYVVFMRKNIALAVPCDLRHVHIFAQDEALLFCISSIGAGHTSFPNALIEKKYKVRCTSRNLNTLLKMLEAA